MLEYYHLGLPGSQPNTVRLKKWRLCGRLWTYIRLLLQFQRNQITGLKLPLRKQKNYSLKHSVSSVEADLDFEIETLVIYKEFVLHFLRNPKWATTLEQDQEHLQRLKNSKKPTDDEGRDRILMQFFLIYRIEQKQIVASNLTLVDWLLALLFKTKHLKEKLMQERLKNQPVHFDRDFKNLYLRTPYGPEEDEDQVKKGFEINEDEVEQFP